MKICWILLMKGGTTSSIGLCMLRAIFWILNFIIPPILKLTPKLKLAYCNAYKGWWLTQRSNTWLIYSQKISRTKKNCLVTPWLLRRLEKGLQQLGGTLMEMNIQSFKGLLFVYLVWHAVFLDVNVTGVHLRW